jgi:outer membrane receptor protein involved in Fe transport
MVPEHLSSANGDLDELRLLRTEMESSLSALQTATKDLEDFALKNPRDIDAIDAVTRSRATARRYLQSLEDVSKTFSLVVNDVENAVRPPTSSPRDIGRQVPDYLM